jgi:hypothetical protein
MEQKERIKIMMKELKRGEPFMFHRDGKELIAGFRMQIDENHDEIEIIRADFPEQIKYTVVKNKRK